MLGGFVVLSLSLTTFQAEFVVLDLLLQEYKLVPAQKIWLCVNIQDFLCMKYNACFSTYSTNDIL